MGPRLFLVSLLLCSTAAVRADDNLLTLELSARADNQQQTAGGQSTSAAAAPTGARPVLTARPYTKLHIRWSIVNPNNSGDVPDVTVHFFVDQAHVPGQSEVPKPGADVVYESALTMDFAAHAKSSADFVIAGPPAGNYLLRLETIGAARSHGHEYVAAIDLKVTQ